MPRPVVGGNAFIDELEWDDDGVTVGGTRFRVGFGPDLKTGPDELELECQDVKSALVRVVTLLNELQVELVRLETEEPNLERVFLHLTGRALRD